MENVRMIVEAIEKVKSEAKQAAKDGDLTKYREFMGNLLALENCLLTEVKKELKIA